MTTAKKRDAVNTEARAARMERVRKIAAKIRADLKHPFPSSDHNELYGEDGLSIEGGSHFELTDVEPALKD